jgi:hypothetical protein
MLLVKENIIGEIFYILHWASWADYIGYIALTPYVGKLTSNLSRSRHNYSKPQQTSFSNEE